VNAGFLIFLFSDKDMGIQFLKVVGLIRSKVPCNTRGRDMTWCADSTTSDGFRWRCRRKVAFINEEGDHTNTIESKWGHVKAYLKSYKRKEDYIYHFAHYMFAARCKAEGVNQFTKFLHLVASTDWSSCAPDPPLPSE
jgi:hypothetical protein